MTARNQHSSPPTTRRRRRLIRLLTTAEILSKVAALDIEELIELAAITADGRGDHDYRVKASAWFQQSSEPATKPAIRKRHGRA